MLSAQMKGTRTERLPTTVHRQTANAVEEHCSPMIINDHQSRFGDDVERDGELDHGGIEACSLLLHRLCCSVMYVTAHRTSHQELLRIVVEIWFFSFQQ